MKAEKLVVVSDTHGIRRDPKDPESLVRHLTVDQIDEMVKSGAIGSGMISRTFSVAWAVPWAVPWQSSSRHETSLETSLL